MNVKRLAAVGATGLAAAIVLTGCSTVGTQFDQTALHYKGGFASAKTFAGCVAPSTHQTNGPNDKYYVYPAQGSQRSFDFTGDKDAESGPITITAKGTADKDGSNSGSAQVLLPGVVTFNLNNDCKVLQAFHQNLGNKYKAWWGGSDFEDGDTNQNNIPDGWENLLRFVMGNAIKNVSQDVGNGYDWQTLYSDATVRLELQNKIQSGLTAAIKRLDGSGENDYFLNLSLTLNQPDLADPKLKQTVVDQQSAVAQAHSAKAQADAQKSAADAQVAVAEAESRSIKAKVGAYGSPDAYIKQLAIQAGMNPFPNPVVAGQAGK